MSTLPRMTRGEIANPRFSPAFCGVWAVLGTLAFFGLAAAFTPFILVLVPVGVVGLLIIRRRGVTVDVLGLVVGLPVVVAVAVAVVLSS